MTRWNPIRSPAAFHVRPRPWSCIAEYGRKLPSGEIITLAVMSVPAYTAQDKRDLRPEFVMMLGGAAFHQNYTHYRITRDWMQRRKRETNDWAV